MVEVVFWSLNGVQLFATPWTIAHQATSSIIVAWSIAWREELGRRQSMGPQSVRHV